MSKDPPRACHNTRAYEYSVETSMMNDTMLFHDKVPNCPYLVLEQDVDEA